TVAPGWAAWNEVPRALNESVNDDAAKTDVVPVKAVTCVPPLPPQADSNMAATTTKTDVRFPIRPLPQLRGSSITTLVAFTDATATTPGLNPSSSADSRVISDTIRYRPACIS